MRLCICLFVTSVFCLSANVGLADWIIYEEDFDGLTGGSTYVPADPALGSEWDFSSTNEGRARIYNWGGSYGGVLLLDDSNGNSTYSRNEATLTIDLLGYTDVSLHFQAYDSNDEEHPIGTSAYVDHTNADGVSVSSDGTNWYPIVNFSQSNNSWKSYWASISDLVDSEAGLELTDTFQIKFQQYDNYSHGTDGRKFNNVIVKGEYASPVPEPATATLFGMGLIGLAVSRRRRRRIS